MPSKMLFRMPGPSSTLRGCRVVDNMHVSMASTKTAVQVPRRTRVMRKAHLLRALDDVANAQAGSLLVHLQCTSQKG